MSFEEYQDMNRRLSQAIGWSAIPIPGITHYYAGEKKVAKRIFYIGLGGIAAIITGASMNGDVSWPDTSTSELRNRYAIYDIDGLIFEDFPNFINAQQIESITILKSYGATNRYGSVGRGGVFVIRMNNLYKGSSQSLDSALIKGNDYEEELSMISLENNSE